MYSAILLVVPQTHYFNPRCHHGREVLMDINLVIISIAMGKHGDWSFVLGLEHSCKGLPISSLVGSALFLNA